MYPTARRMAMQKFPQIGFEIIKTLIKKYT